MPTAFETTLNNRYEELLKNTIAKKNTTWKTYYATTTTAGAATDFTTNWYGKFVDNIDRLTDANYIHTTENINDDLSKWLKDTWTITIPEKEIDEEPEDVDLDEFERILSVS